MRFLERWTELARRLIVGASHQTGWTGLVARFIQITVNGLFEFPDKPNEVEHP